MPGSLAICIYTWASSTAFTASYHTITLARHAGAAVLGISVGPAVVSGLAAAVAGALADIAAAGVVAGAAAAWARAEAGAGCAIGGSSEMAETQAPLTLGMVAMQAFHGRRYPECEAPGCTPLPWAAAASAMAAALRANPAASDDAVARAGYAAFFYGAPPPSGRLLQDAQWSRAARAVRAAMP